MKLQRTHARNPAEMTAERSLRHINLPDKLRKVKRLLIVFPQPTHRLGNLVVGASHSSNRSENFPTRPGQKVIVNFPHNHRGENRNPLRRVKQVQETQTSLQQFSRRRRHCYSLVSLCAGQGCGGNVRRKLEQNRAVKGNRQGKVGRFRCCPSNVGYARQIHPYCEDLPLLTVVFHISDKRPLMPLDNHPYHRITNTIYPHIRLPPGQFQPFNGGGVEPRLRHKP